MLSYRLFTNSSFSYLTIAFIINFSMQLMGAYLILWFVELGLNYVEIGLVTSIYMISILLVDIPSSTLADKYGRLRVFSVGATVYGIGLILLSLSISPIIVYVSYTIMGIGMGILQNTTIAWIVDSVKSREEVAKIFSREQVVRGIGGFLGNVFAGLLVLIYHKFSIPILIAGVTILFSLIPSLLSHDNKGSTSRLPSFKIMVNGVKYALTQTQLLLIIISLILTIFSLVAWMQFSSPYVVNVLKLEKQYWGLALSIYFLTSALGGYLNERLIRRRINYKKIAIISVFILSMLIILLSIQSLSFILIDLFLISLVYPIRGANIISWENELIPSDFRTTVLSTLSLIVAVMYIVAPPLVGYLINVYGYSFTYLVVGLIASISVIPLVIAYAIKVS